MEADLFISMEWSSSCSVGFDDPTDYVYRTEGELVDYTRDDVERLVVGRFRLYYMDLDRALANDESVFNVFDSYQSTFDFYEHIFDVGTRDYCSRLTKLIDDPIQRNVLILDRLEILPPYRGKGLGLSVLRHMVERFGVGAGLVVMKPFPLQLERDDGRGDEWRPRLNLAAFPHDEKTATRKLMRYYAKLGFKHLPRTPLMVWNNEYTLPEVV